MVDDPLPCDPMEEDEERVVLPSMDVMLKKYAPQDESRQSPPPASEPPESPHARDGSMWSLPRFQVWTGDDTYFYDTGPEDTSRTFLLPTRLDGTTIPPPPFQRSYHRRSYDSDDDEHVRKKQKKNNAPTVTNPSTQLVYPYTSIPQALRDVLEPRFELAQNTPTGFRNVAPQPSGRGYQVQLWRGKANGGPVRLGTVNDPRVGALLYAMARVDVSLIAAPLRARGRLVEIMEGGPESPCEETPDVRARAWIFMHSL